MHVTSYMIQLVKKKILIILRLWNSHRQLLSLPLLDCGIANLSVTVTVTVTVLVQLQSDGYTVCGPRTYKSINI